MKILIADDDLISRKMLQGILTEWGYDVIVTTNGDEALRALQLDNAPMFAILDWVMPGLDGSQVCQAIRERQGDKYVYLLLMTTKSQKSDLIRGLEAGADDYLTKPYDPLELKARIIAGRRVIDLQEQLIAAREAMRQQATCDSLTGAWNHRAIMEILERELVRSRRENRPFGVIMGDLDHFKSVNDTYGHLAGDAILREVSRRMGSAVRPYDQMGRYGGEEFLFVLPGCDQANTLKLGERIRELIAQSPVPHLDKLIQVTISLGATTYIPPEPVELYDLLHAADAALYRAKGAGRNRVEVGVR